MAENIFETLLLFTGKVQGNGFQQLNKHISHSYNSLFSLRNMFGAFFGYDLYSAFRNLIPQVVETSQKLGAMKSRFNAVSTSAKAGADELNWVGEQSKRLGLDFLRTADDYSIFFATVSKNMGQGTTRKVFEQWAEAFRVLHIDPERQTRVLYALREMSSKGKIYMQDLALQLGSAVPDAMNIAAKSMGYTGPKAVNKFRDAIKKGEVDVKKFIPAFSAAINKQYVSSKALNYAMGQTDAQLQLISTHWQFIQKNLLESGFQEDIVNFLKTTNRALDFAEKHSKGIHTTVKGLGGLLGGLILLIGGNKLIDMFIKGFEFFKALGKVKRLGKLIIFLQKFKLDKALSWIPFIISRFIMPLLGLLDNPVGWTILVGLIIAGIVKIIDLVLKKFFPNVHEKLFIMSQNFKMWFLESIWAITDEWNKSPLGKLWHWRTEAEKSAEKNSMAYMGETPYKMREYQANFNLLTPLERMQELSPFKASKYGTRDSGINISKIDASIHIDGTNINNPEQVGMVVRDAYDKIFKDITRGIPNSKISLNSPFALSEHAFGY